MAHQPRARSGAGCAARGAPGARRRDVRAGGRCPAGLRGPRLGHMTWWLWLVLVLAALAVFAVLGVGLWRRGKALLAELQQLGDRKSTRLNSSHVAISY